MTRRLSPIEMAITSSLKCTRCGAGYGECDCWAEVTLECPDCGRTKRVTKDETDPPNTARVRVKCDRCDDGDFALIDYFDAEGRQIDMDGKPIK